MHLTPTITKREQQVLCLIADELTVTEIAEKLHLSYHTIISYRKNLKKKLMVKNTAGMIRKAFELGILLVPQNQLVSIRSKMNSIPKLNN